MLRIHASGDYDESVCYNYIFLRLITHENDSAAAIALCCMVTTKQS